MNDNKFLVTEPVPSLMRKYAFPCIISLLVGALYNIVDQIFIANASYLGSYGNAANTVVFPLTVIALATAVLIGDGCCTYVSICLGAGRREEAHKTVGNSVMLCIVASLVITGLYLVFAESLVNFFGGSVNSMTFSLSMEYFFYIAIGIPFFMFGQAMNPVIRSDGSPAFAMVSTVAGAVVNIILDPIFIFVFKWGMMGAAVATVAGQVLTAILAIWYLYHMKAVCLEKSSFGFSYGVLRHSLPLGFSSFLCQISMVLSMAAVNNMVVKYSALDSVFSQSQFAQIPMAVIGIAMKFFQIVISISLGFAAGSIPVIGYNIGAKRYDRTLEIMKVLLWSEALLGFAALLVVEFFPHQLIQIFGASKESVHYTQFAIRCFRIYLCMILFACLNKGIFIYMQALGKALIPTVIAVVREVVFGVGWTVLLPLFFGLDGVLYSMPVSDFLMFLIAIYFIRYMVKNLKAGRY